ncbi:hypothetical protein ACFC58_40655 [Kitasatospora purpeofusca]|uniref:hypothetical protein n=1 Tax=Kitasatospora purpeofusca TaxID=67352 RepID=UPI0035DEB266
MRKDVLGWPEDELLRLPETEVIDHLVGKYTLECPELHRDQIHMLPVRSRTAEHDGFLGREEHHVTVATFVVPFTGDAKVFSWQPQTRLMRRWEFGISEQELRITWEGTSPNPEAVQRHLDQEIGQIEQNLASTRGALVSYNASLRPLAEKLVADRRAKLLGDRGLEAALGFPVRHREGPQMFSAPSVRRKVSPRPTPSAAGPFEPEPEFAEADYEEALRVIARSRNALERTPQTTAKMGEERIRDLLLVSLNSTFEGQAGGEVFNGKGKTDILIREQDRNIFIGECKVWRGPQAIGEALDQLLGYTVWRDTKAALLLFIHSGAPTEVITKAITALSEHSNCKRVVGGSHERHDFVFRSVHDPDRDIRLALLPFHLPR